MESGELTLTRGVADLARDLSLLELNDLWKIQLVLATYTRAMDRRAGKDVVALFAPDGVTEIYWNNAGVLKAVAGPLDRDSIAHMVEKRLRLHASGVWGHHVPSDPIIELSGDTATVSLQLIVLHSEANREPQGAGQSAGRIEVSQTGYYEVEMKRHDRRWWIARLRVVLDLPL